MKTIILIILWNPIFFSADKLFPYVRLVCSFLYLSTPANTWGGGVEDLHIYPSPFQRRKKMLEAFCPGCKIMQSSLFWTVPTYFLISQVNGTEGRPIPYRYRCNLYYFAAYQKNIQEEQLTHPATNTQLLLSSDHLPTRPLVLTLVIGHQSGTL